jgi:hypothetical protein
VLNFAGSPIHPPLGALDWYQSRTLHLRTNRLKRWILRLRGWWSMTRRRSPSSTSQEMTSPLTQARVTRRETERRRGASRRSSTMTATPPLLHQGMTTTMTLHRKRKRLIRITLLIILAFLTIQMRIYYQFHLENLQILMERIIRFGVIKCVVICSLPS